MIQRATKTIAPLAAAAGAIALGLGSMWLAGQGALLPDSAEAAGKFLGTIYQGARSLPILIAVWVGALGLGWLLRIWLVPDAKHRIITQMILGIGGLLMIDWLLASVGWLNAWTAWSSCGIGTAVVTYHFADGATRERWHPDHWPAPPWAILLALPALGVLLVACTMPPGTMWAIEAFGYDVTSYHLEVPRQWLAGGQMVSLKNNIYSHLPLFIEAGYAKLSVMHGSVFDAIYTIHFFHACAALLAATAIGRLVADYAGSVAGIVAGAAMLASPWTIITGSMAYSEMFVMLFGIGAIIMLLDPLSAAPRGALVVGLFAGLATMAKLTAGGFIALPVGAAMIVRLAYGPGFNRGNSTITDDSTTRENAAPSGKIHHQPSTPAKAGALGMAALGALLMLSPYLIRNTLWTGNPVFPFAASTLGGAHWNEAQIKRWNEAHHAKSPADGLAKLPRQWLLNTGFGAIGGGKRQEQSVTDIARFDTEYGLPLFWLAALTGLALLYASPRLRPLAITLSIILATQLLFWLFFTHHQSRFLIPTLLPGCIALGVGLGRLQQITQQRRPWLTPMISVALIGCMTMSCFATLWSQTPRLTDPRTRERFAVPPYVLIDSLVDPRDVTANQPGRFAGQHPLNQLPATSKSLLVGEAGNVFYIQRAFLYNTAFDRSLLAELLKQHKGNALAVTFTLVRAGFTHVWINTAELARLHDSYGVDEELAPDNMRRLMQTVEDNKLWRRLPDVAGVQVDPHIRLYALPAIRTAAPPDGETKNE